VVRHHGHPYQCASEVDEIAEIIRTAQLKAERSAIEGQRPLTVPHVQEGDGVPD
jgi:hypothetical protein